MKRAIIAHVHPSKSNLSAVFQAMMPALVTQEATAPRDKHGRFFPRDCTDPNCDGKLVWEDGGWVCNGLTWLCDDGDLHACTRSAPVFK